MSRSINTIIDRQRAGQNITKADLWDLKYEFERAVTDAIERQIERFAFTDLDPWRKVIQVAIGKLEDQAYDRGLEEGRKDARAAGG